MKELLASLLIALAEIESNNNDRAVGRDGERSRYQIRQATWEEHAIPSWPFRDAVYYPKAKTVASSILLSYQDRFEQMTGRHAMPRDIYVLWNMGVDGYAGCGYDFQRVPKVVRERAERFANIVADELAKGKAGR